MKTLGLALGAGGSRGVAHVGFLKALEEAGLRPDYICGCSMGSVVGAAYASGMTADEIWEIVGKLRMLDILSPSKQRGGLFSTKKCANCCLSIWATLPLRNCKFPSLA